MSAFSPIFSARGPLPPELYEGYSRHELARKYILIDVETTGTRRYAKRGADGKIIKPDRIVEIYLRKFQAGKCIGSFYSLFNPGAEKRLTYASRLHQIRPQQLVDAPYFKDRAAAITSFIRGFILVGHNCSFDAGFLHDELLRAGFKRQILYKCTRWMAFRDAKRARTGKPVESPHPQLARRRAPIDHVDDEPVVRRIDFSSTDAKKTRLSGRCPSSPGSDSSSRLSFSLDAWAERENISVSTTFKAKCEAAGIPENRRARHGAPFDVHMTGKLFKTLLPARCLRTADQTGG